MIETISNPDKVIKVLDYGRVDFFGEFNSMNLLNASLGIWKLIANMKHSSVNPKYDRFNTIRALEEFEEYQHSHALDEVSDVLFYSPNKELEMLGMLDLTVEQEVEAVILGIIKMCTRSPNLYDVSVTLVARNLNLAECFKVVLEGYFIPDSKFRVHDWLKKNVAYSTSISNRLIVKDRSSHPVNIFASEVELNVPVGDL